jgi:hypothetical protein
MLLIGAGGLVLAWFGIQWGITGALHIRPLMLLSLGAVIVGIQFFSFGFLAEMLVRMSPHQLYYIRETIE